MIERIVSGSKRWLNEFLPQIVPSFHGPRSRLLRRSAPQNHRVVKSSRYRAATLRESVRHSPGARLDLKYMSDVVYRSEVRIERIKGPVRRAFLPAEPAPVIFGVHGAIAEHYKVPPAVLEPHATTLDYVVAAAAG
jgi:hypothetical protein